MRERFGLRDLLVSQKSLWLIAWAFGVLTAVSVLGLVMVAGWFVTVSAVAGVAGLLLVNYGLLSLLVRVFAVGRTLFRYGDLMVSHHAVFGLLKDLRVRFFKEWATKPPVFDSQTSSQKMHRLVKDIDTLDEFPLRLVSPWVVAVVALVLMALVIVVYVPQATGWAMGLFLMLMVAGVALNKGIVIARQESTLLEARKSMLVDALPALTQLLIWQRWTDKMNEMSKLDEAHHTLTIKAHELRRRSALGIQLVVAMVVAGILLVVNGLFVHDMPSASTMLQQQASLSPALTPALVLALVLGLFGLIEVMMVLVGEPLALGRSLTAKQRLNDLICRQDTVTTKTPVGDTDNVPALSLLNLSVKIPTAIFGANHLTAVLTHDKPTLIMGASGAGKSTLLATLAGEIAPVGGRILWGEVDFWTVDFGRQLGFLGQNVDIFDQSLRDNLRLGKPASFDPFAHPDDDDDELWAVLDKVGLSDWAKSQPKGLDTPLGEYGMAISGGQARRIALARLLLDPKQILLLDEPFAGLDNDTRKRVWQSLTELQQQGHIGILIIATHQMSDEMAGANVLKIDNMS